MMARRLVMQKSKDSKEMLVAYLKELHLPAFRASWEELARQAQQEGHNYEQYLLGLAQRECQERRNKRVERLLHDSRLPLEKSWQTLDRSEERRVGKECRCRWSSECEE